MSKLRKLTDSQKKFIAGSQKYKCANNPHILLAINKLINYKCPLWRNNGDGSFDEAGYEIDHIEEYSINQNDNINNLQALCLSCHRVKTKKFLLKNKPDKHEPPTKYIYNEHEQDKWNHKLLEACKNGDVDLVEDIINSKRQYLNLNKGFVIACDYGYMHIAKLLKSYMHN